MQSSRRSHPPVWCIALEQCKKMPTLSCAIVPCSWTGQVNLFVYSWLSTLKCILVVHHLKQVELWQTVSYHSVTNNIKSIFPENTTFSEGLNEVGHTRSWDQKWWCLVYWPFCVFTESNSVCLFFFLQSTLFPTLTGSPSFCWILINHSFLLLPSERNLDIFISVCDFSAITGMYTYTSQTCFQSW